MSVTRLCVIGACASYKVYNIFYPLFHAFSGNVSLMRVSVISHSATVRPENKPLILEQSNKHIDE